MNPEDCKCVLLVLRHGARFPMRNPGDHNWPEKDKFWEKHSATLTPEGTIRSIELGKFFRNRYSDLTENIDINNIYCYTSDIQRTIITAWSLLNGWFPNESKHITNDDFLDNNSIDICISDIFHHKKINENLRIWQNENRRNSREIYLISKDINYINLSNCLHNYYGLTEFKDDIDKIIKCKIFYTQHKINECQLQEGYELYEDEIEKLKNISRLVHKYKFVDSKTENPINEHGSLVSGRLAKNISDFLETSDGTSYRLNIYSGHDTTLFSLASILGIDIDVPEFNGYFLIEYYNDHDIRFYYNKDPIKEYPINKKWIKTDFYQNWNDVNDGSFTRDEILKNFTIF